MFCPWPDYEWLPMNRSVISARRFVSAKVIAVSSSLADEFLRTVAFTMSWLSCVTVAIAYAFPGAGYVVASTWTTSVPPSGFLAMVSALALRLPS